MDNEISRAWYSLERWCEKNQLAGEWRLVRKDDHAVLQTQVGGRTVFTVRPLRRSGGVWFRLLYFQTVVCPLPPEMHSRGEAGGDFRFEKTYTFEVPSQELGGNTSLTMLMEAITSRKGWDRERREIS